MQQACFDKEAVELKQHRGSGILELPVICESWFILTNVKFCSLIRNMALVCPVGIADCCCRCSHDKFLNMNWGEFLSHLYESLKKRKTSFCDFVFQQFFRLLQIHPNFVFILHYKKKLHSTEPMKWQCRHKLVSNSHDLEGTVGCVEELELFDGTLGHRVQGGSTPATLHQADGLRWGPGGWEEKWNNGG